MGKSVLVLGGTGALGSYLVPELVNMGHRVHVISLDDVQSGNPCLIYEKNNAMDDAYIKKVLEKGRYDAIVDYMGYGTQHFEMRHRMMLDNTNQYLFLSSYRVYADAKGLITEETPRLLDMLDQLNDPIFAKCDDYSLSKARQEDMLTSSGLHNYTIIRPAITFSSHKFQLNVMEANSFINRAFDHKTVVLPEGVMDIQGTLNWSRDIGKINFPILIPTIMVLLVLQCGSLLSVGYEKVYLLQNDLNLQASEVISTYVYKMGLEKSDFSFSTATGLFNSIINCIILLLANSASKHISGSGLW